jgi:hypothetical protein
MMAKRGIRLIAVHFASPPYTSERSLLKVKTLCEKLRPIAGGCGCMKCPSRPFRSKSASNCPEEYFTLIMRRFMMEIAERIACAGMRRADYGGKPGTGGQPDPARPVLHGIRREVHARAAPRDRHG